MGEKQPPPSYESLSQYPGEGKEFASGYPGVDIPRVPVYNPQTPFNTSLYGGLHPGQSIYICGIPYPHANRFNVNFCLGSATEGCDIAFHFDVRFQHSDGYHYALVRNTLRQNEWGREERDKPCFPFERDMFFEMVILVEADRFRVAVNNQHLTDYNHRVTPLSVVNHLNIDGDIRLCQIKIQ